MGRRQEFGRWGEEIATQYLLRQGYEIVARNVRTPYGEIDIIARKEGLCSFVEVKARRAKQFGPPEVAVNSRKLRHMISSADSYAQEYGLDHWKIDVIAIEGDQNSHKLTHFEDAAGPTTFGDGDD